MSEQSRKPIATGQTPPGSDPLLALDSLSVGFKIQGAWTPVLSEVSFAINRGETLALVGESGSGKSVTAMSLTGLITSKQGRYLGGEMYLHGSPLSSLSERAWSQIRGTKISMIFQEPSRALDPCFTVGYQVAEPIRRHLGLSRKQAWARAVELLDRVQIPSAAQRAQDYPHMLSGGMCQRVMIAAALSCKPELLIADEPTTALDVTVQASILELLRELRREMGMAVLFITHDLGVVSEIADKVAVFYAGQVVETGRTTELLAAPSHPYTAGLLGALLDVQPNGRLRAIPGQVPPPTGMPAGCRFHPRCSYALPLCEEGPPPLMAAGEPGAATRCLRHSELTLAGISDS